MSLPQQVFKNRKEALNWVRAEGVSVSQGKFYQDCDEFHLVQPDKTVLLCDLVAYMRRELKTGPRGPAQDIAAEEHARIMRELELRKLRADVEAKERSALRETGSVIERDDAEMAFARKLVVVYNRVRAQFRRDQDHIMRTLDLPAKKSSLLVTEYIGCLDRAFNAMRDRKEFDVMIEDEDVNR